jgi:hypothetical protein
MDGIERRTGARSKRALRWALVIASCALSLLVGPARSRADVPAATWRCDVEGKPCKRCFAGSDEAPDQTSGGCQRQSAAKGLVLACTESANGGATAQFWCPPDVPVREREIQPHRAGCRCGIGAPERDSPGLAVTTLAVTVLACARARRRGRA